MVASQIPGLLVGAGTVTDAGQAAAAAQAGARFAVAPGLSEPVVAAAREIGLPFFPGVATPTEIGRAADLGCRVLKVFPVSSLGGPGFLRSSRRPILACGSSRPGASAPAPSASTSSCPP